jgi:hypothetical protein
LISRQAKNVGLPLNDAFVELMGDKETGKKLFKGMKTLFHLCVGISPIMALNAMSMENISVRREQIVAVSIISRMIIEKKLNCTTGCDISRESKAEALSRHRTGVVAYDCSDHDGFEWAERAVKLHQPVSENVGERLRG